MSNTSVQVAMSPTSGEDSIYFSLDPKCLMNDGSYDEFPASLMDQPLASDYLTDPLLYSEVTDDIFPALGDQNQAFNQAAMLSLDSLLELPFGPYQDYAFDPSDDPSLPLPSQRCILDYSTDTISPHLRFYPGQNIDQGYLTNTSAQHSLHMSCGPAPEEENLCVQLQSKLLSLTSVVSLLQEKVDMLEQKVPEIENELEENSSSISQLEDYMQEFRTWSVDFKEAAEDNAAEVKQTMERIRSRSED